MLNEITSGARWIPASLAALALAALLALGAAEATRAAPAATVFTVANTNDSGPGSLRQAISAANRTPGLDTIRITAHGTVHLASTLVVTDDLTLLGPGADLFAVDGGGAVQVFNIQIVRIDNGGNITYLPVQASISSLTVQNGNAKNGYGGGIVNTGGLTLTNVSLLNNLAGNGGGVYEWGGPVTLIGGRFANNTAQTSGGGLNANGPLHVTGTQFINNTADFYGGGLVTFGKAWIQGARFENNRCPEGFDCVGGGLATVSSMIVTDTLFVGNTATGDGGGAWLGNTAEIHGGQFQNNQCITEGSCSGGGLYANSRLTVIGTRFVDNSAGYQGGGLHAEGPVTEVTGARFEHNRCELSTCRGGGMHVGAKINQTMTFTLNGTEVVSNTGGVGGGVDSDGYTTITASRLADNKAVVGGGLAVLSERSLTATLTMDATDVVGNTATSITTGGGGMFFRGGELHITGSRFVANTTPGDGGGVYIGIAGNYVFLSILARQDITSTQFLDNHARRGGGAFLYGYLDGSHIGYGRVTNALFARNRAPAGGAIFLGDHGVGGSYDMLHTTIDSGVPVTGTAIEIAGGSASVRNTILVNHAIGIKRVNYPIGTVFEDANLYFHTGTPTAGTITRYTVYPQASPRFANAAQGDYRLSAGSPAIDKAVEQNLPFVDTDFEGEARPFGAGYDIGLDEYVPRAPGGLQIGAGLLLTTTLGTPTSFIATAAGTAPITYTWDFGDGTPAGTGTQVAHTYAKVGHFTVTLTVTNGLGQAVATMPVTVLAAPPPPKRLYLPLMRR